MSFISNKLGAQLVELLGLPKSTRNFTLTMRAGEVTTISCDYFPEPREVGEAFELLHKEYVLQEKVTREHAQ